MKEKNTELLHFNEKYRIESLTRDSELLKSCLDTGSSIRDVIDIINVPPSEPWVATSMVHEFMLQLP